MPQLVPQTNEHIENTLPLIPIKIHNVSKFSFDDRVFLKPHLDPRAFKISLSNLSKIEQESRIFIDICDCIHGIDGIFIYHLPTDSQSDKLEFFVDSLCNSSLANYVTEILKFICHIDSTRKFHDDCCFSLKNSQILQYFSSLLRPLFIELSNFVNKARQAHFKGQYSIHSLWYDIQQDFSIFPILSQIIVEVRSGECCSSSLLDCLMEKCITNLSDAQNLQQLQSFTDDVVEYYLHFVSLWMKSGELVNSFNEFFIVRTKKNSKVNFVEKFAESHWNDYFKVNERKVPKLLGQVFQTVFECGKFSYTLKQALGSRFSPRSLNLNFSIFHPDDLVHQIHEFHQTMSVEFLNYIITQLDLEKHFEALCAIFFLNNADFVLNFLNFSEKELSKDLDDIIITKVESSFDYSIQQSTLKFNPMIHNYKLNFQTKHFRELCNEVLNAGEISTSLHKNSQQPSNITSNSEDSFENNNLLFEESLNGFESLCFDYSTKWPLSIIISEKVVTSFQIIFRFLLQWKLVEQQLLELYRTKYLLRERTEFIFSVLKCITNFLNYFQIDIIDTQCQSFFERFQQINSISEASEKFHNLLSEIISSLFLDNKDVLSTMFALLESIQIVIGNINDESLFRDGKSNFARILKQLLDAIKCSGSLDSNIFLLNRLKI
ncbi:MAG: Gamma-tubulin complex component 2 [Marteilia pararefringens]